MNPRRRIRQHNGEISSGAIRTRRGRPWEMVLVVYGFPTQVCQQLQGVRVAPGCLETGDIEEGWRVEGGES